MNSSVKRIDLDRDCIHVVFLGLPNIPGGAAKIFGALCEQGVSVDMITQNTMRGGRSDLSFLIHRDRLEEVIPICREVSDSVNAQGVSFATEVAAITVRLEAGSAETPQVLAKMFSTLAGAGVNVEIINSTLSGSEGAAVVCIVSLTRAEEGLKALREAFEVNP
ncbi:MAG: ACT domain-containing protein [Fretibacterium sp.]|nr:ACT domain-containing protein [Fretibacterium sp.]